MEDAGGWHDDTVCEDLCLSTRAVLLGWRFLILPDIVALAELPNTMSAYKNQQARWTKGSFQCLKKFFWPILKNRENTIGARLYGILAMSIYFGSPLVLIMLVMQLPILMLDIKFSPWLMVYSVLGIGQPILYIAGQHILYHREEGKNWWRQLRYMPAMFIIAIGIAPNQTRAMLEVLLGRFFHINHTFVRTPKGEQKQENYRLPFDWIILVELFFALYVIFTLFVAISMEHYGSVVYLTISGTGLLYVFFEGIKEQMQTQKQGEQQREQAVV